MIAILLAMTISNLSLDDCYRQKEKFDFRDADKLTGDDDSYSRPFDAQCTGPNSEGLYDLEVNN